jgi:Ni/Fe-hydrogenase subunit HybB-like protein
MTGGDLGLVLSLVEGYIYPNEVSMVWTVVIAMYPYITGLVAGAFIVASLERVFKWEALKPTYKLSLLTALAFLLVATMPLLLHLGNPLRGPEIFFTPHFTSAMAAFGFVYLWYLMAVLCLEIWYDYRVKFVEWSQDNENFFLTRWLYKVLTLFNDDVSEEARKSDDKIGYFITLIGLPSAVLLHGYVGFIFGSIKANPWWNSPMMPIIFLFSAIVSGVGLLIVIYNLVCWVKKIPIDRVAMDKLGYFLLYVTLLDATLEAMEIIHMFYASEESIEMVRVLISDKLFFSLIIIQVILGTLVPIALLTYSRAGFVKSFANRRIIFLVCGLLVMVGVFFMRWNVVIGGQLFSKSLYGFKIYDMTWIGKESASAAILLFLLPFLILAVLLRFLPPWEDMIPEAEESG